MNVQGSCDAQFQAVRGEFERNFQERGEVGASVCVVLRGQIVVTLWGGTARCDTGTPWTEETVSLIFSSTKGATALCGHILASRGLLDLDASVAEYWREFTQARKGSITVKMLLNHQAGLPALRGTLSRGAYTIGTSGSPHSRRRSRFGRTGYHGFTFGWLVGEVVRRVSGKSLGTFFQDQVARPLGIDFWIGLPRHLESRVARMIPVALDTTTRFFAALQDLSSLPSLMFLNTGGYMAEPDYDSPAAHTAEMGGSGGITNARGLACLYAPLASGAKGLATRDRRSPPTQDEWDKMAREFGDRPGGG